MSFSNTHQSRPVHQLSPQPGAQPGRSMQAPTFQLQASRPLDTGRRPRRPSLPNNDASQVPDHHVGLNIVARRFAYRTAADIRSDAQALEILTNMGYNGLGIIDFPGINGFYGMLIPPTVEGKPAILAFRGTEFPNPQDLDADLSVGGVGDSQYNANRDLIVEMLVLGQQVGGGPLTVTGHSLGGALAQLVTAEFQDRVGELVTFQAPGISKKALQNGQPLTRNSPDITHHIISGDFVDKAGFNHIPGTFFQHHTLNDPRAHLDFPLITSEFEAERAQLGLETGVDRDNYLETNVPSNPENTLVTRTGTYPRERLPYQRVFEMIRSGAGGLTAPIRVPLRGIGNFREGN